MLITDKAKDPVVFNWFEGGAPCLLFICWFISGILHEDIDCVSGEKFPCDDLCGESESFTEQFEDVSNSPVLSVEIS